MSKIKEVPIWGLGAQAFEVGDSRSNTDIQQSLCR